MSAGVQAQVHAGLESLWGTAVVPSKGLAVQPGDGIQTDVDVQFRSAIKNQLAKNATAFLGAKTHEGEYELDFVPNNVGYLIKSAMGSVNSVAKSAPNAVVYDHTFSEAATKPSLTIEQSVGEVTRRFAGTIVHTLTFACEVGQVLSLTAGLRAKSNASATAVTPSFETVRPFNFADFSTFSIGGQALTQVQSFSLTYANNHGLRHAITNSNDPQFNYPKASEVSGSLDLYLDATTAAEYADYLNGTEQALLIGCTGDAIGSSSNYGLQISVPRVKYKTATVALNDDANMFTIEFEGIYDTATSRLLSIVLTNLLTSYN